MTELQDLAQLMDIQESLRRIRLRIGRLQSVALMDADVLLSVAEAEIERAIGQMRETSAGLQHEGAVGSEWMAEPAAIEIRRRAAPEGAEGARAAKAAIRQAGLKNARHRGRQRALSCTGMVEPR